MSNDNVEVLYEGRNKEYLVQVYNFDGYKYEWYNYHYFDTLIEAQELADKLINRCSYSKTRVIRG